MNIDMSFFFSFPVWTMSENRRHCAGIRPGHQCCCSASSFLRYAVDVRRLSKKTSWLSVCPSLLCFLGGGLPFFFLGLVL